MAINPNPVGQQMAPLTLMPLTAEEVPQPIAPTDQQMATLTLMPLTAEGVLQSTAPPGFTPKPQTTAQSILKQEGISSSRQLLESMKVPSAKDILSEAGITSTQEIFKKEEEKRITQLVQQAALQKELKLREEENKFIKNYKFDPAAFNPTIYETKYGELDLSEAKLAYGEGWEDKGLFIAYNFDFEDGTYFFMPESIITKGLKNENNQQLYNWAFLNEATYQGLAESAQYIDLRNTDMSKIEKGTYALDPRWSVPDAKANDAATTGFLFNFESWKKFKATYLDNRWGSWGVDNPYYGLEKNKHGGDIQGISRLSNGELIYVTQPSGGHDQVSTYIARDGRSWLHWYNAPKRKTLVQKFVGGVGDFFNAIPLGAEIAVVASGGALLPYYPAIKGSQAVAAGGDFGDVITSMALAALPQTGAMKGLTSSATSMFTDLGLTAATAEVAASALVSAGFNGTIAALTGQDVEKAIVTGALSGGIAAGTPKVAAALFKNTDLSSLANSVGLRESQLQNLVVSSVGNAAISSAIYKRDFFESFSQILVVNGISTAAANKVTDQLRASNTDPAKLNMAINATRAIVGATARSAVRGTDINEEIKRATASFSSSVIKNQMKEIVTKNR